MEDDGWRPTSELRIVPIEGSEFIGTINMYGPRGTISGLSLPRYRVERMYIRTWAEKEWRVDGTG